MPREYLKKIEHAAFPLRSEDEHEIECIYILRAAGMLEAAVTPGKGPDRFELAVVYRITLKGRHELDRLRRGEPPSGQEAETAQG